jgi:putative transcriptional regulator
MALARFDFPEAESMKSVFSKLATTFLVAATSLFVATAAHAQKDDEAVILVAKPQFRDAEWRQTVLIASPAQNGGHIGVIINRPTTRSLSSLFPEHEPSKKVVDPVYFGGPFSRRALFAVVRADANPGGGAIPLMKNLYFAMNVQTVDRIIETTPNDARFFVGYVGWRPGELRLEIDRGLWFVMNPDSETLFRKDMDGLWEELVRQARQVTAGLTLPAE